MLIPLSNCVGGEKSLILLAWPRMHICPRCSLHTFICIPLREHIRVDLICDVKQTVSVFFRAVKSLALHKLELCTKCLLCKDHSSLTNKGRAFAKDKVLYMHMHGTDDEAIQNLRVPLEI